MPKATVSPKVDGPVEPKPPKVVLPGVVPLVAPNSPGEVDDGGFGATFGAMSAPSFGVTGAGVFGGPNPNPVEDDTVGEDVFFERGALTGATTVGRDILDWKVELLLAKDVSFAGVDDKPVGANPVDLVEVPLGAVVVAIVAVVEGEDVFFARGALTGASTVGLVVNPLVGPKGKLVVGGLLILVAETKEGSLTGVGLVVTLPLF